MNRIIQNNRLYTASCLALLTIAMTFAIRAKLEGVFKSSYGLSNEDIGLAFGPAFWSSALATLLGGTLVDYFGMKGVIRLAMLGHLAGILLTLFARDFWALFFGMTLIGLGDGMIEAVCNPLVATLYPEQKTKMLNRFHIYFPLGMVIGSALSFLFVDTLDVHWMVLVGMLFIPFVAYVSLFAGQVFPPTQRISMGISRKKMLKACVSPLFIFMACCMMLSATTELGTNQRITSLLEASGVTPLLVLTFISGLMAVGRYFAGALVHRIHITTLLLLSALFSFVGLWWLSYATGAMTFVAAGVFAVGVCYFWPTMLSFVADKIPESGALGLSVIGGIGMFSVSVMLWFMGLLMDTSGSSVETLRVMSILPGILMIAFLGLGYVMRKG